MKWDTREPCKSCPYRLDAPKRLWDPIEFERLLASDTNAIGGAMFGCHKYRNDPDNAQVCGGWLLDQKRRNSPNISLRVAMIRNPAAMTAHDEITDGGHEIYPTIAMMCIANGVVPTSRRLSGDEQDMVAEMTAPKKRKKRR